MTVNSMTGFARSQGTLEDLTWHWELRSVNGRGLDIRLRFPPGYEALEQPARKTLSSAFARGNVSANLTARRTTNDVEIQLNEHVLHQVLAAVEKIRALTNAPAPTAEGLINTKGVLDILDKTESTDRQDVKQNELLSGLDHAITELKAMRGSEGQQLHKIIQKQLDEIDQNAKAIKQAASNQPEKVAKRFKQQIDALLGGDTSIQQDRLHQEIAILLTKADVSEELDRIDAHIIAARELLQQASPIGRKLDFLTQEFNREANTICSKSNDITITQSGLAMKAAIDQMREQVQNVE